MPIMMKDVRAWLDADEVDYANAAKKLGSAAIPFLMELVQGGDLGLASKATYLASLIKGKQSGAVVEAAVARNEPVLLAAAASSIGNLPVTQAAKVLDLLKDDPDTGIRKVALNSAAKLESPRIVARVQQMAETDPEPFISELAASSVKKMKSVKKASSVKKTKGKKK